MIDMQFDHTLDSLMLIYCNKNGDLSNDFILLEQGEYEGKEVYFIGLSEFSSSIDVLNDSGYIWNYDRHLAENSNRFLNIGNKYYLPIVFEEDFKFGIFHRYSDREVIFRVSAISHNFRFVFDVKKNTTIGYAREYSDKIIPLSELGK